MVFNDADGIYTFVYEQEKNPSCLACSNKPQRLEFSPSDKLQQIIDYLINTPTFQMKVNIPFKKEWI